jgi:hypothetical protein
VMANPPKETQMVRSKTYEQAYGELAEPALNALRGLHLNHRQYYSLCGLIAETAGRAAEMVARRRK